MLDRARGFRRWKFDYLGTRVNGPRAGTVTPIVVRWTMSDTRETLTSTLEHGALTATTNSVTAAPEVAVTTTRPVLEAVILGQRSLADALSGDMTVTGNGNAWHALRALIVDFRPALPLVSPAGDGSR